MKSTNTFKWHQNMVSRARKTTDNTWNHGKCLLDDIALLDDCF